MINSSNQIKDLHLSSAILLIWTSAPNLKPLIINPRSFPWSNTSLQSISPKSSKPTRKPSSLKNPTNLNPAQKVSHPPNRHPQYYTAPEGMEEQSGLIFHAVRLSWKTREGRCGKCAKIIGGGFDADAGTNWCHLSNTTILIWSGVWLDH